MPVRRLCSYPGCSRFAEEGSTRCDKHPLPKREFPDSGWLTEDQKKFYHTSRWRTLRAKALRDNPVCQMCGKAQATEVHHLYPRGYDFHNEEDFFNSDRLVCLCRDCHQEITRKSMTRG